MKLKPNTLIILIYLHVCELQVHIAKLPFSSDGAFSKALVFFFRIFSIVRPRKLLYMAIDGVVRQALFLCDLKVYLTPKSFCS